ncbi:MAG: S26 family signal peptidase, partial [Chitinophagaceae bacterium]
AYSGDIIELKDGDLFVNKRHVPLPYTAKTVYELRSTVVIEDLEELLIPYGEQIQRKGDTIIYQVGLSEKQAAEFRQRKPAVLSVRRSRYDYQVADSFFARSSANDHWSSDNYGPLKIPSPGDTVEITAGNYKLYKNIPGIAVGKHPVTEKLYFLLGDNRNGAEDSRYMGLVPHSKMYGIVKK